VLANSIATINTIAPGRVFVAIGTGNTAMRMLGRRPALLKDFAEYIRVVKGLIRGEEVDFPDTKGASHKIKFSLLDREYININDYIPLYVAADGPKTQALAGELADGVTTTLIPHPETVEQIFTNARAGAKRASRTLDDFHLSVRGKAVVLAPGEPVDSDRIVNQFGPAFMSMVHKRVDRYLETGEDPPAYLRPIWNEYLEFHMNRPAELRQRMMHETHEVYVNVEERHFITPEMLKTFLMIGRPEEVVDQIRDLQRLGVRQVKCNFPPERASEMMEDFARDVIQRM
jgi:alkanesulfonate monooxygenase SsuD/methylene tetrahydromethanopterin reductase-like flavin-dependent oxidoreductase (luciferase family)